MSGFLKWLNPSAALVAVTTAIVGLTILYLIAISPGPWFYFVFNHAVEFLGAVITIGAVWLVIRSTRQDASVTTTIETYAGGMESTLRTPSRVQAGDGMSIFPTRILMATDGSQEAEMAATTAVNLAKNTGSELHVLAVGAGYPVSNNWDPEVAEELRQRALWQAQDILNDEQRKIERAGGKVEQAHLRLTEHPPSDAVVQVAEEIDAGLVVVGSRGLGGIRRALMGSVSDSVVRHAHSPVLVVRDEPIAFPTKILVALNRSREAEVAAQTAADLAQKTGSELHVVHVAHMEPISATEPEPEARAQQRVQEARELLDEQVERIEAAGGTVAQTHFNVGEPDMEIVQLAEELGVGLIMLGSQGHGGTSRALTGSVSDSVVRHAHCPVLIVRY